MGFSLFRKIYESQFERRDNLLFNMNQLDEKSTNCSNCTGKCCTMMANSMMVTPIEAIDLRSHLYEKWLWNDELKERLQQCIDDFRLDEHLDLGRGRAFRRTYTCPFYKNQSLGCPLPPAIKPYGCLAFNPTAGRPIDGQGCKSDLKSLEKRESLVSDEEELNNRLKAYLGLDWDKKPIPVALLEIDEILSVEA